MKSAKRNRRPTRRLILETLESRFLLAATAHPFDLSTLDGQNGFRIDGETIGDQAAHVSDAGDVNGDGFGDIIIGAPDADTGVAYVVFGKRDGFSAVTNVGDLDGSNGFTIRHASGLDLYRTVGSAGDVNDDGCDDLVIGNSRTGDNAGETYVVFGKKTGFEATIDLASLNGANGFRILGEAAHDRSGYSVSGAGDVNGDGFDDVIIGVSHKNSLFPKPPVGNPPISDTPATAYVVFGKRVGFDESLSLAALDGTNGFSIDDTYQYDRVVSGAGDVNGDGLDDVMIGHGKTGDGLSGAHVVFGISGGQVASIHVDDLDGNNGFRLHGTHELGGSVSAAGDVNGDGLGDIIVGDHTGTTDDSPGEAWVVFGNRDGFLPDVNVASLDGKNGFRIAGENMDTYDRQYFGVSVSTAEDFNADGYDDLLIGTSLRGATFPLTGLSYVVFGRPGGYASTVEVSSLDGSNGFRLESPPLVDQWGGSSPVDAGRFVSAAGDVNGDGYADLMLGAPLGNVTRGSTYIVFGGDYGAYSPGVTAEVVDGTLEVIGDDTANHVRVTAETTFVVIEGLDGTTINGQHEVQFDSASSANIVMGKGADTVVVTKATGFLPVTIDTGPGKDFVELNEVISGTPNINTGGGDDHLVIRGDHISGPLDVNMGKGDDRVRIEVSTTFYPSGVLQLGKGDDVLETAQPFPQNYDVMNRYDCDGGPGSDRLANASFFLDTSSFEERIDCSQTHCFIGGDVTTEVIADPAIGNILVVKGKDHFDHDLQLGSSELGQVTLDSLGYGATINGLAASASFNDIARVKVVLGSGTDTVRTDNLMLSNKLIVKTGLGNDNVQIVGGQLGKLKIDTGGGDDTVLLDSVNVDRRTKIFTRWGEDEVTIRDSVFARKVILEGGLDEDTLELLGENLFNKGIVEDFEL